VGGDEKEEESWLSELLSPRAAEDLRRGLSDNIFMSELKQEVPDDFKIITILRSYHYR